jgi:hypothetical protein
MKLSLFSAVEVRLYVLSVIYTVLGYLRFMCNFWKVHFSAVIMPNFCLN